MIGNMNGALRSWSLACLLSALCFGFMCTSVPADDLAWPKVTRETKPWSRWWWMGSIINEKDVTAEMDKYTRAGLGGLEITPIYGVKGYEDRFIPYLSPQWMDMLNHTLKEAERLDLGMDMATGNGWPFGGPWVSARDANKNIVHQTYTLKRGGRLTDPIVHIQKPMTRAVGRRGDIEGVKEPISANENLQALALDQVRFEKPLPLLTCMAYSNAGQTVDLTEKIDVNGLLDWTAPEGEWTLYAVFQGWHGKMVERAGPGGEGNVIDHFSKDALTRYLNQFDEAFTGRDIGSLRAFFNDSYEVDDARGEANWTPDFLEAFAQKRGYDLRNHLPALFGKDAEEKNLRVLCDFRETLSDLLLEQFTVPWDVWAQKNGATTRNQAHGSPANILDLYAASGIPETEGNDILKFKFASSAAHVTGKLLASSESATWLDEHFHATLGDVKQNLDLFFLGGINHICYHGTNFSPADETWPGWLFYASVHFGPTNTFWSDFAALNQYVTRCQSFLQSGRSDNDVLLYFPIYDRWSQPPGRRGMLPHFDGSARGMSVRDVGDQMLNGGWAFDLISDRQLTEVQFANGALQTGGDDYQTIVVPECQGMPLTTFRNLIALAQKGATVVFHQQLPTTVPGWGNLEDRNAAFQGEVAGLNFTATGEQDIQAAAIGNGRVLLGSDLKALLAHANTRREVMVDQGLKFVRRSHENGQHYFIANAGEQSVEGWVPLQTKAKSVGLFDPMHGERGLAAFRTDETGASEVYLQLAPGASCIVKTFDTAVQGSPYVYWKDQGDPHEIQNPWSVRFVAGGPELPLQREIDTLSSWTAFDGDGVKVFAGTATYMVSFKKPKGKADGFILDLGRVHESAHITFNGEDLGTLIQSPFQITIPKSRMKMNNTLEIDVSNTMANRIADLDRRGVVWKKFYNINFPSRRRENRGPDRLFSSAHWEPQDSGLIGPVRLIPVGVMKFEKP
jgi:hypothetical protein